jgi:hypothetical protein
MLRRKTTSMALLVVLTAFLFIYTTGTALAKTSDKKPKLPTKTWAQINGFRSAKFGMDQKKVMRAIAKDFKISKSKVQRNVHHSEGTASLLIKVPNLLAAGGDANIGYVLGQTSKKLIQVNILWGKGVGKTTDNQSVLAAANLLRDHFAKKRYQGDSYVLNGKISENLLLVFRGKDEKGRLITLTLNTPTVKKGQKLKNAERQISLNLAYILDPVKPDILTIKEGDF